MDQTAKQLAKKGRNGDTKLAHLTPGEVVVPKSVQPAVLGLLSDAFAQNGHSLDRYTVGDQASKNPRTGLLEFAENEGGDANGRGGDGPSSTGRGTGSDNDGGRNGQAGPAGRDGGFRSGNDTAGDVSGAYGGGDRGFSGTVYGRDMYGNIAPNSELGGLLGGLGVAKSPMGTQDRGWRGTLGWGGRPGDANTPSSIGLFGGFLPGTGTFSPKAVQDSYTAAQALNAMGFSKGSLPSGMKFGSSMFGPPGAIVGAATDAARMASAFHEAGMPSDQANALAGNLAGKSIMGNSVASVAAGMLPGPLGMVASYGAKAATASPFGDDKSVSEMAGFKPDKTTPGQGGEKTGIAGLMDSPIGSQSTNVASAASGYNYTPGPVAAVNWSPVQWGTQYDPVRGLLA